MVKLFIFNVLVVLIDVTHPAYIYKLFVYLDNLRLQFFFSEGNMLGSTPLQVACSMDQDYENSTEVIKLLLEHGANTNVVCSGHSPLTLAIYSGNDKGKFII